MASATQLENLSTIPVLISNKNNVYSLIPGKFSSFITLVNLNLQVTAQTAQNYPKDLIPTYLSVQEISE